MMKKHHLEKRVQQFIHTHKLIADHAGVLVGVSGGADSVCLLSMLVQMGYRCHAVHCNFHLRDEESNRDETFTTEFCRALGVPCQVVHFDTQEYASEKGISIEMAAREQRYEEFERLRQTLGLDVVAVAHHQDDAVETLLLNLIRGAGINGLTGMRAVNGHVVRPLLCISHEEVLAYLDSLEQPYVTDSTNLTDEYARNKVRLKVLPMMQEINPAAKENILQAASHLTEAARIYNSTISKALEHVVEKKGSDTYSISIAALLDTEEPRAVLFEVLYPYGFGSRQIGDIYNSLSAEAGRIFYAKEYTLLRDRTHLSIQKRSAHEQAENTMYTLPYEGTLTLPDGVSLNVSRIVVPQESWQVPRRSDMVCIDAARVCKPLTVRHPRQGDRFRPFGMRGSKLLSDFYTDIKLPRTEKERQWVVCHGEDIVWAVGLRSSERYRLCGTESSIICIEINEEGEA